MVQLEQKRFNEFLASIEGLNPKTLSARLREMEKSDIIKRTVFPGMPVRVEYFMTEKGRALTPILDQMAAYSMKYCSKDVFKDGRPRGYRQVYGKQAQIVK
jgi:DNA-binding HxlR family transcriptional regulator